MYASRHYPGMTHDKTMLEEESKKEKLPSNIEKLFDLAFIGINSVYPNAILPNKKPKGKILSKRKKMKNRIIKGS